MLIAIGSVSVAYIKASDSICRPRSIEPNSRNATQVMLVLTGSAAAINHSFSKKVTGRKEWNLAVAAVEVKCFD